MRKFFFLPLIVITLLFIIPLNNNAFALDKQHNLMVYNNMNKTVGCANGANDNPDISLQAGSAVGLNVGGITDGLGQCGGNGIIAHGFHPPDYHYDVLGNGTQAFNWLHDGSTNWTFNFWWADDTGPPFPFNGDILHSNNQQTTLLCNQAGHGVSFELGDGDNSTSAKENHFRLCIDGGGKRVFDVNLHSAVPTTLQYHMFTVTFKPSTKTMQYYVDGVLNQTASNSTLGGFVPGDSSSPLKASLIVADASLAQLDELSFWNTILTPADVTLLYNNTHGYNLLRGNGLTPASITLTPNTGPTGTIVSVTGSSYGFTKTITTRFDGNIITTNPVTVTSTSTGLFNETITIPSTTAGSHTVNATDNTSPKQSAIATFTVTPSVILTPSSGTVHTSENSLGTGFAANSALTIKFDGVIISTTPASPKTDHLGQFNNTLFSIPNTFNGIHTIRVTDGAGNFKDTLYTVSAATGFSLSYNSLTLSTIGLTWLTPPVSGGEVIKGYQINYTTPYGTPQSVIFNNTNSISTSLTLSGLYPNTQYSFRVGVWTNGTTNKNMTNILDVTTLTNSSNPSSGVPPATPPNLVVGNLNFSVGTNPTHVGFQFFRQNTNPTTIDLFVGFPTTYTPTCNLNYEFANTNKNYSSLATVPNGTGRVKADFQFLNLGNEIVNVKCVDTKTNDTSRYTLTNSITSIPLVQQVQNFETGVYGTAGQFGAFDLVELIVIVISMIGLNRVDERVGAITMIFVLAGLAYFHIGSFSVIIFGALAVVILLIVGTGRKLAITP